MTREEGARSDQRLQQMKKNEKIKGNGKVKKE